MHLVVLTQLYFFWAVCHPNRTFPPKEPEQEPQNRFSSLLTSRPFPLTSDPWPTTSYIGWVHVGGAWALRVLDFCLCPKPTCCSCIRRGGLSAHPANHPWLLIAWVVYWSFILLWLAALWGWAFFYYGLFLIQPILLFFSIVLHFLPYHSATLVVMLFDPSLLGLFGSATRSPLNDSMWSFGLCIALLIGSFVPFISFWASLAHLLSLGFLNPFPNFVFPWACHQPLTFFAYITLSLQWPILTFLQHILSMG